MLRSVPARLTRRVKKCERGVAAGGGAGEGAAGTAARKGLLFFLSVTGEPCKMQDTRSVLGVVVQKTFGFPEARDTMTLYQEPDSLYYRAET